MKVNLECYEDGIALRAPRVAVEVAKQIPGARHDRQSQLWRYPLSWATCVVARGVFGVDLEVGPELAEWAQQEYETRVLPAMSAGSSEEPDLPLLHGFQRAGVRFLRVAGSALLADDMGLGKTVQAITALEREDAYPALVVCPNSVKSTWAREYRKWAPTRRVVVARSGAALAEEDATLVANGGADVLVVNWEALKGLSRLAPFGSVRLESCSNCDPTSTRRPSSCQREDKVLNLVGWRAIVADEAHRAKDPHAQQTRALWALGDRAERRIALTGTPIANTAEDLWAVLRFVSPDEFPTKWAWIERYALTSPNFYSGGVDVYGLRPDTRPELDKILLPRLLRRTKAEVLTDLPAVVRERRDVVLPYKQRKAYDQMAREMDADIEGGTIVADNVLVASLRLRQLASAYGEVTSTQNYKFDDHGQAVEYVDQQVRLTEPSAKLDVLEEVLDELGDRQAVIFAESAQLIELAHARLAKRGDRAAMIIGSVPQTERGGIIEEFGRGIYQYLLLTLGVGGEGVDGLQVADTAIFLQRPWSAVLDKQAEARLHRLGQQSQSVTYIDLVATETIEDRVFSALRAKADALEEVVHDAV